MWEGIAICWATAIGLGCWVRVPGIGMRTFLGWISLPLLLFALSDLLGVGLRAAAWIVTGLSALGFVYGGIGVVRKGLGAISLGAALNPIFVVPIIAIAALMLRGGSSYVPVHWDEFSMWLLWPKLQFLADRVWTDEMEITIPGYPPGWQLMLVFPQLFVDQFSESRSVGTVVVLSAALLGLLFDTSRTSCRPQLGRVFWGLGLLLCVPLIPAAAEIIPSDVLVEIIPTKLLVEPAQIALNVGVLALMLAWVLAPEGSREARWLAAGVGLALAVGYFIKSAMVLFVPLVALAMLWHLFQQEREGWWGRDAGITLLLALGPFVAVFVLWQMVAPTSSSCLANPLVFLQGLLGIEATAISLSRFTNESATFLSSFVNPFSGFLIAGSLAAMASKKFRVISLMAWGWVVAYFCVLYGSYLGCFGGYEQQILASLERYESVPFVTITLLGALIGLAVLPDLIGKLASLPGFSRKGLVLTGRGLGGLMVLVAIVVVLSDSVVRFGKMSDRFSAHTKARQFGVAIQTGRKIREIANERFSNRPRVRLIAQGSDGREKLVLRYMRVPETQGHTMYLFDVEPTYSWSPYSGSLFANQAGTEEMMRAATDGDIIWPLRIDPWTGQAINAMTSSSQCRTQHWAFLFVRRIRPTESSDPFDCVLNDMIVSRP